jgi:hypothetical protein
MGLPECGELPPIGTRDSTNCVRQGHFIPLGKLTSFNSRKNQVQHDFRSFYVKAFLKTHISFNLKLTCIMQIYSKRHGHFCNRKFGFLSVTSNKIKFNMAF